MADTVKTNIVKTNVHTLPHINLSKYRNTFPDIKLNTSAAEAYLKVLSDTKKDALKFSKHIFVFAVFPDKKNLPKEDKQQLTRQLIGTWNQHKDELLEYNRAGCGIFATINKTDGYGRRNHNIIGINTVFVEDDDGTPKNFPIKPSMIIETSPRKYHYYFLTDTLNKLEARAVQEHMVTQYNSDKNAKDLSRVLRIPGFNHLKNQQHKVKLIEDNGTRYNWNDIIKYFPPAQVTARCTTTARIHNVLTQPDIINILTAISFIDPQFFGERGGWLNIIMALHYEFRGQQEGRKIALEWSKGKYYRDINGVNPYETTPPSTYVDDDDINYIWDSFSFDTSDKIPITIGTLFAKAGEKGFIHNFEPPPFVMSKLPETADSTLKKISRYYAIVRTNGGDVRIVYRDTVSGQYSMMNKQSFELDISNLKIPTPKRNKAGNIIIEQKAAAPIWLQDNNTHHYRNLQFCPTYGLYCSDDVAKMPETVPADKMLNQFFGFYVKPKSGDTSLIEDLILNTICNGHADQANHFHKWIAFTRRYPEKKTGLMITLMGEKGTGKSVMASIVMALHAPFTYVTSNFKALTGQFNAHFAHTTMIGLEEATWGGRDQDNSILKDLITQDTMVVNTKYLNVVKDSRSCFDIIATANPGFSVPEDIRSKERRFWTLSVSDNRCKDKNYFKQFGLRNSTTRKNILESYAYYLDNLDLETYDPQDIPKHVGEHSRYNQIESGGDSLHFLIALCENEEITPEEDNSLLSMDTVTISLNKMWNNTDDKISKRMLIPVKLFKQMYTQTAKFERTSTISAIHVAKEMDQFLPKPHAKQIPAIKEERTNFGHLIKDNGYLEIPNRKHCIAHLKKMQLWT